MIRFYNGGKVKYLFHKYQILIKESKQVPRDLDKFKIYLEEFNINETSAQARISILTTINSKDKQRC